ncbi:SIR2 family protein [Paenibacillus sp. FSL H7-0690]|uniref:SIR2 family protein n=1 Tax=Paenibacillus sp. FSL H7-0690 TaxID=2921437 RepID=UPI0030EBCE05
MSIYYDPIREMNEFKNQISFPKKLGFLFGAGTSMALGMPGIFRLSESVISKVSETQRELINQIDEELISEGIAKPTIEHILNKIRMIRQITRDMQSKSYVNINGNDAKELDKDICDSIYSVLSEAEAHAVSTAPDKLHTFERFFSWYNKTSHEYCKEIFTFNYDMIFERSLENLMLPYFDGFVGAFEPFFCPESVERAILREEMPQSWTKLWKLHGSLGWFWKNGTTANSGKVVRLGVQSKKEHLSELVIYPSREKYDSSRKQPFVTYFDRLKSYLKEGEGILIISGYSFGDEHINDIIFEGLRKNNRLHIVALFYDNQELIAIENEIRQFLNISVYSPKHAIISGKRGEWKINPDAKEQQKDEVSGYWDMEHDELIIGDFLKFVDFITGVRREVASTLGEKL